MRCTEADATLQSTAIRTTAPLSTSRTVQSGEEMSQHPGETAWSMLVCRQTSPDRRRKSRPPSCWSEYNADHACVKIATAYSKSSVIFPWVRVYSAVFSVSAFIEHAFTNACSRLRRLSLYFHRACLATVFTGLKWQIGGFVCDFKYD